VSRQLFDGEIARDYDVAANGDFYTMTPAPDIATSGTSSSGRTGSTKSSG
jgi:hypothetical protein